jgi:superfamily II DNA/RNA helicase
MSNFENIDLSLIEALKKQNISQPTKVQEAIIPKIIANLDLIVESETGSGKTLAYVLPLFEKYKNVIKENKVIILVPTYELAMQVFKQIEFISTNSNIKLHAASIIGDVDIDRQITKLKEKPEFIVGTPGRILKLIEKRKITAHLVKTIVIDEADRMLDRHNIEQVKAVIKTTQKDRQLLLFSASILDSTVHTAKEMMKSPELIRISEEVKVPSTIEHQFFVCERRDKIDVLRKVINIIKPKKSIIFTNKPEEIEEVTSKLIYNKISAESLYGENDKFDRKKTLSDFKEGKLNFLVASDIAARGIDIEDVDCVFNLTMSENPKDYLHRAGRTGRTGKSGLVISIVTSSELPILRKYQNAFNIEIKSKYMFKGIIRDSKFKL